jgi:hypothetical protein
MPEDNAQVKSGETARPKREKSRPMKARKRPITARSSTTYKRQHDKWPRIWRLPQGRGSTEESEMTELDSSRLKSRSAGQACRG